MVNNAADLEIEKDLIRWRRARWVAVILAVVVFQGVLLFLAPRGLPGVRATYPQQPVVNFVHFSSPSEWLELQDTTLFAGANPFGFSGPAWMIETPRLYVAADVLPSPSFLQIRDLPPDEETVAPMFAALPHTRSLPDATPVVIFSAAPEPKSRLEIEGFARRQMLSAPPLPLQYATDVLRPTVLKALVDSDGSIFSCRVIESSGSKIADNSALDVTRKILFSSVAAEGRADSLSSGKITFHWYALDASATNAAPIKATQR
jgi:hypothetical protein